MIKCNFRKLKEVVINLKCEREVFGEKELVNNFKQRRQNAKANTFVLLYSFKKKAFLDNICEPHMLESFKKDKQFKFDDIILDTLVQFKTKQID